MRSLWRLIAIILPVILIAAPAASSPASAHVFLFKSVPADGAVLPTSPGSITAIFTGEVALAGSSLSLYAADGSQVDNQDTSLDPTDARNLIVTLPPLAPGAYHAVWIAVDALDGHTNQGDFNITIGDVPAAPAAPANLPAPPAADTAPASDTSEAPDSVTGAQPAVDGVSPSALGM
jgi:methionine-rich copper-binding protein CopC